MKARVTVIKTGPETAVEDYGRLMRAAGYLDHMDRSKKTCLGINLSSDVWFPAASTTPWQLEGVIKALLDDGIDEESLILALGRSPEVDGHAGAAYNGFTTVAGRYGLELTHLHEPPADWVRYEPRAEMLVLDRLFQEQGIFLPGNIFDTNVIHLPTIKTRLLTATAGAMENALAGMIAGGGQNSPDINEILVDLLAIQQEIHSGIFAVVDGTICGDGPGPRQLMPFIKDYIIAGADQVAVDAVAAHMMGFNPMDIKYIRLAHERGLGCGAFEDIEISGEDIAAVNFQFKGDAGAPYAGQSKYYYEYFWYPFIGWPRLNRIAETEWGQLLQSYLPEGSEVENQGRSRAGIVAVAAAALVGMAAATKMFRRKK
ncbi:MAG: DUF362 domain-containing protein [Thermoleophilia bacterium]